MSHMVVDMGTKIGGCESVRYTAVTQEMSERRLHEGLPSFSSNFYIPAVPEPNADRSEVERK